MRKQEPASVSVKQQASFSFLGNESNIHIGKVKVKNCLGCGYIMLESDFLKSANCLKCERPLTSNKAKERRRRKLEGRLEGDDETLILLEAQRDKLVEIDKELALKHVI